MNAPDRYNSSLDHPRMVLRLLAELSTCATSGGRPLPTSFDGTGGDVEPRRTGRSAGAD